LNVEALREDAEDIYLKKLEKRLGIIGVNLALEVGSRHHLPTPDFGVWVVGSP